MTNAPDDADLTAHRAQADQAFANMSAFFSMNVDAIREPLAKGGDATAIWARITNLTAVELGSPEYWDILVSAFSAGVVLLAQARNELTAAMDTARSTKEQQ